MPSHGPSPEDNFLPGYNKIKLAEHAPQTSLNLIGIAIDYTEHTRQIIQHTEFRPAI
jgi:hypothetical protein